MEATPDQLLPSDACPAAGTADRNLQQLERHDWWLWWCAITVMMLLTATVVMFSIPSFIRTDDSLSASPLAQNVRALVAIVVLFNCYAIYREHCIKRLRSRLANQAAATVAIQTRAEQFQTLAAVDPLTGLYNRREASQRLEAEISESVRHHRPLAAVAIDLDDFKQVNDEHGHAAGDAVLTGFADTLRKVMRISDVGARVGGDEFLLLLPDCKTDDIEKIMRRMLALEVDFRGTRIEYRLSAGWAQHTPGEPAQQFLERCDAALYARKRNRKEGRGVNNRAWSSR